MSDRIATDWLRFVRNLLSKVEVSRSLPRFRKPITGVELHTFGDASGSGISAAGYAVITQASGVIMSRGLLAAKSRLAKKNLIFPKTRTCVSPHGREHCGQCEKYTFNLSGKGSLWVTVCDSTVALHWIKREALTSSLLETDSPRSTQRNSLNGDMSTVTKA